MDASEGGILVLRRTRNCHYHSSMASEEQCMSYEDLRNKNVERNRAMMQTLGLLPSRPKEEVKISSTVRASRSSLQQGSQRRRSERVATKAKLPVSTVRRESTCDLQKSRRESTTRTSRSAVQNSKRTVQSVLFSTEEEVHPSDKSMHQQEKADGYDSDVSLDSMYAVEFDIGGEKAVGSVKQDLVDKHADPEGLDTAGGSGSSKDVDSEVAAAFNRHCQEMILQIMMQSAKAFNAVPIDVEQKLENLSSALVPLDAGGSTPQKTWSERTYNIVKARRQRETKMTRTSAGEGSDSQKDIPIPENESPQQRAVRNRRLNRLRAKRAKDLTDNRRAFKKRPYVLHVDGMAKARGIHRHIWRAALRGQCGRLDPTMDNINHHPKKVVDSIWEALQKEWEFEGFSHRAREMFERSATKFMRNRKMQLKYKCQRTLDDSKPDDVNETFWKKIVQVTKKDSQENKSVTGGSDNSKGKRTIQAFEEENEDSHEARQSGGDYAVGLNSCSRTSASHVPGMQTEHVDARIRSLQEELLRLQKSREVGFKLFTGEASGGNQEIVNMEEKVPVHVSGKVLKSMKENIKPPDSNINSDVQSRRTVFTGRGGGQETLMSIDKGKTMLNMLESTEDTEGSKDSSLNVQDAQMDCGDVVRVFAYSGGVQEEIGKAVVMGLSSSKFGKKFIPKAWRSIKMTSWTTSGGSKTCPFPPGWPEQSKSKTVDEVNGRIVLWPDILLRSVCEM